MADVIITRPQYKINEQYQNALSYRIGSGYWVCVSVEDYYLISIGYWFIKKKRTNPYAYIKLRARGKLKSFALHRIIASPDEGLHVDHINHDTLDNRRENLRACTPAQNCRNSSGRGITSRFKGVSWNRALGKWRAGIKDAGKTIYLGNHVSEEDAAMAYNIAAKRLYGDFANLNVIQMPESMGQ